MSGQSEELRHPDAQRLGSYLEGDLSEAEAEEIRHHLVECADCAAFVLELAEFSGLDPDISDLLSPAQQEADRERLLSAIAMPGPVEQQPAATGVSPYWRIAACLLVVVAAVSLLWKPPPSTPVPNAVGEGVSTDVSMAPDLRPGRIDRRGTPTRPDQSQVLRVPPWARRVHLLLNVGQQFDHPAFRVEIAVGDEMIWEGEVYGNPAGNFSLIVPRELLSGDPRQVRLLGETADGSFEPLAVYLVSLDEE